MAGMKRGRKPNNSNFELNLTRVRMELARIDQTQTWLAEQIGGGLTRQRMNYYLKVRSLKYLKDIARILKVNEKELVVPKTLDF